MKLKKIYETLLNAYGCQGWWPLISCRGMKGFDEGGYHKGLYDYPKNDAERFEIIQGAILTQYNPFSY